MEEAARRGRRLAALTVAWNSVEAVVAIAAGGAASSTALIGFGLDSVIESTSGAVILWRLAGDGAVRERRARLLVGASLLVLALYVAVEASRSLLAREAPDPSAVGIALAAVSVVAMPVLARAKRRVNRSVGSQAMHADSRQTDLCAYLSVILLGGLLLNAVVGWWWADPAASLCMVPLIASEGWGAMRGKGDCC
jgi:divalent metal cation (Fe/Co/Zn/Cd) transporter